MLRLLVTGICAGFITAAPAIAKTVTLECPKRLLDDGAATIYHTRYEIRFTPSGVYVEKRWKREGGKYAHDWNRQDLLVESVTPYKIRAYTASAIYYEIDRATLTITTTGSGHGSDGIKQCDLVKIAQPKF